MSSPPVDTQASIRHGGEPPAALLLTEAETFACEAAGEPQPACPQVVPKKPRVDRVESTGHMAPRNRQGD